MVIDLARRKFIAALGGAAAAWPLAARAQQADQLRRIGVLVPGDDDAAIQSRYAAFLQGLQQLGWIEGRNVHIDIRWSGGNPADVRKYAAELVALAPDVILSIGSATGPLLEATRTVPIVFVIAPDGWRGRDPSRPTRRGRDRSRRHDLRAVRQWRSDPDGKPVVVGSS